VLEYPVVLLDALNVGISSRNAKFLYLNYQSVVVVFVEELQECIIWKSTVLPV